MTLVPRPLLAELLLQRSWKLEKVSPTTNPSDVVLKHNREKEEYTQTEINRFRDYIVNGSCYRCRIGRAKWYYHNTIEGAISAALKAI